MGRETKDHGTRGAVRGAFAVFLSAALCLASAPSVAIAKASGEAPATDASLAVDAGAQPAGAARPNAAGESEMGEEVAGGRADGSREEPATATDKVPGSPEATTHPTTDEALPADGDAAPAETLVPDGDDAGLEAQAGARRSFPDVPAGAWYAGVVGRAAGLGLISGYSNGRFGPNDRVTRGQVAVILWNMAGKPDPRGAARSFPDVGARAYYYSAVRWASSVGVVSGYKNGRFGPNDPVTREQLAAMIASDARVAAGWRALGSAVDFQGMRDAADVSDWARSAVGWCCRNGVLNGSSARLRPLGNATRAEAAKMIVFLLDLLRSGEVSDPYSRARDAATAQGKLVLEGTVRVMSAREVAKLDMNPAYNAYAYSRVLSVPKSLRDLNMPSNYDWDRSRYAVLMLDNYQKVPNTVVRVELTLVCRYVLLGIHDVPGYSFSKDTTSRWNPYNGKRTCVAGGAWYPYDKRVGLTASMGSEAWEHDAQILYTR